jgi:putative PEP-CTERM system integral membrane protein
MIKLLSKNWIKALIFWAWNVIFTITLITIQLNEPILFNLLKEIFVGLVPLSFGISSLIILTLPFISLYLAVKIFKGEYRMLIRYFYGVEVPILFLCILRITVFRELTFGSGFVIYSVLCGVGYFAFTLFKPQPHTNTFGISLQTLIALIGIYTSLIILIFVIPFTAVFINGIYELVKEIIHRPSLIFTTGILGFMIGLFLIATSTLFIISPIAIVINYLSSFLIAFKQYKNSHQLAWITPLVFSIVFLSIIYFSSSKQPQQKAFTLMESAQSEWTSNTTNNLIQNEKTIKKGLLNAYLAPYRYTESKDEMSGIKEAYKSSLRLEEEPQFVQDIFNTLMYPFLYQSFYGSREDIYKAEKAYENIFDAPIQKAEKDLITKALSATWDNDQAEAGILNIDEKKVLVTHQDITVNEQELYAEVTLHERYINQTFSNLEILYYFSMPDNAVITGLWLSDDDSIPMKYHYKVSPKGAAQKIYKQEVARRVDPSLLEQVGPNQYRLRAFPIERKQKKITNRSSFDVIEGTPFHLWLSYAVLKDSSDIIPTPCLLEQRNVYQNNSTQKTNTAQLKWNKQHQWFPTIMSKVKTSIPDTFYIEADDLTAFKISKQIPTSSTQPLNIAVIVDQSYSMNAYKDVVWKALESTQNGKHYFDLFTHDKNHNPIKRTLDEIKEQISIGICYPATLLNNFTSIQQSNHYDGIIFLTDQGSYELDTTKNTPLQFNVPLIFCHINGLLAPAYADNIFETILASNGTSTTNFGHSISYIENAGLNEKNKIESAHLSWQKISNKNIEANQSKTLQQLAQHKHIQMLIKDHMQFDNAHLDNIHHIAVANSIVSPYSSMIVLVNDEQWKRLKEAELNSDRFQRDIETGKENLSNPWGAGMMEATATPEPHEWALLIIAGCILLWAIWKRQTRLT